MIRILQVVNKMDRAGLETMLMNYYRHIDREKVQFDFLTHRPDDGDYDSEILSLGGRIYKAPRLYPQNYARYFSFMKSFFMEHPEYRIIHSHIDAMSAFPLAAARRANIPVRIAHSHNTAIDKDFRYLIKQLGRAYIPQVSNQFFACGEQAGAFLFKKRWYNSDLSSMIIHNAIELDRFVYDDMRRMMKRKELGIEDRFVIGHVGRFTYVKNQSFLLDIMLQLLRTCINVVLLLVGTGDDLAQVKEKAYRWGLSDKVYFLGVRSDIPDIMQAMDAFVLPSLFEGFPMVAVEAQAADLPCFFSDTISKEVKVLDDTAFIPLDSGASVWAKNIMRSIGKQRTNRKTLMTTKGFNIEYEAKKLQEYYIRKDAVV